MDRWNPLSSAYPFHNGGMPSDGGGFTSVRLLRWGSKFSLSDSRCLSGLILILGVDESMMVDDGSDETFTDYEMVMKVDDGCLGEHASPSQAIRAKSRVPVTAHVWKSSQGPDEPQINRDKFDDDWDDDSDG